ncbi:MAG: SDR family NAD(P)-dependent oxidoreductase, partial [Planctomycetaceae bacterium]|nr:SDR family NAD(P)-dependent oxidoreductase [Planctomycetaceae bacterium]
MPASPLHPSRFQNRVALVTGGSRGIGRACCLRLAQEGARVAINYRRGLEDAQETLRQIEAAGGTGMLVQADVSDSQDVDRMVGEIESNWGPVELLVNNSGIFIYQSHTELTENDWRQM